MAAFTAFGRCEKSRLSNYVGKLSNPADMQI
jgi:hypothetical protein